MLVLLQDELEAELEELEGADLEEQLLKPIVTSPAVQYTPASQQLTRPTRQQARQEEELAALQAEMAL